MNKEEIYKASRRFQESFKTLQQRHLLRKEQRKREVSGKRWVLLLVFEILTECSREDVNQVLGMVQEERTQSQKNK